MLLKGYNELLKDFIVSEIGRKGVIVILSYTEFTLDNTQEPLKVTDWVKQSVEKICAGHPIHRYEDTALLVDVNDLNHSEVLDLMNELEVALMWEGHAQDSNWNEPHFYNGHNFLNRGAVRAFGIDLKYDKKCLSRSDTFYKK
jgi:hypothetical protein